MTDEVTTQEAVQSTEAGSTPEAPASSVVSLSEMGSHRQGSAFLDRLTGLFANRGWLAGVIIGALLLAFLFLPPVSLGARLGGDNGYTAINAEMPAVSHPDGLTVSVDPAAAGNLRVKLGSVPRADFMGAAIPEELLPAREALPSNLTPKSPLYTLAAKGEATGPVILNVVIPNEAEPWETLDLYAWDGAAWRWVPGRLDRQQETLTASLEALPPSVMVMQTAATQQSLVTESSDLLPPGFAVLVNQVDLVGMKIGTLGGLNGDPGTLPPGSASPQPVLAPTVRNWIPGRDPNRELVTDMLAVETDRAAHIANLTALVKNGAYQGLVLDYRSLRSEDRAAYAAFVAELARSLHEAGAWLAVTVEEPQKLENGWDTGGYDWLALGAAADQVRVMMPLNPQAYAPGGLAEQLIVWGTTQISRYKFYPVYTTLSTDGEKTLTMAEVLSSVGTVSVTRALTESVLPGTALTFQLQPGAAMENDALTGASRLRPGGDTSVWLGTPQWLRSRLDLVARYHLGGVVLRDLLDEGNFPGMDRAVTEYRNQTAPVVYAGPEVVWSVIGPKGQQTQSQTTLSNPSFVWTAPEITGTYRITASVAGLPRGGEEIKVAALVQAPPAGEEAGITVTGATPPALTSTPPETSTLTPEAGLRASFVADVTIPDNTKLEKNQEFTKTWRVKNSGSQPWPADTVLAFTGEGTQVATVTEVAVGKVVEPGQEVEISVPMKAPAEDGTYRSVWALKSGNTAIPGGSFYVLFKIGEAAPAPAPVAPVAPVAGGPFELGGHIMQGFAYADYMRSAGMTWVKEQVRYPNDPSGVIAAAHANGFKIQLSALGESGMVTQGGFEDAIAQWVAGMAAAGADAIEIWNEPNLDREWAYSAMTPQNYTNLLCRAYAAIKGANPGTKVISAAPAPTGAFGGGGCIDLGGGQKQCGIDDIPWLQGLANAGAANCMDYIGAHHNSGATAPSATSGHPADPASTHHSWFFLPQTRAYYSIFGGSRKLFYTELGYVSPEGYGAIPGPFAWAAGTTVAQQAQWLGEVVTLSRQTGMVANVIVWNVGATCYGMCGGVPDPQAGYNIIRPDGSCPACATLAAAMQ